MNKITGQPLNIQAIVDSGQAFRWQKVGDFFYNVVGDQVLKLRPAGGATRADEFYWQTFPVADNYDLIARHLNLSKNYGQIITSINRDRHIGRAIERYFGLRELRQPLFETVISYIISANNSVKMISRSVGLMCQKWGREIKFDGQTFYSFPDAATLHEAKLEDLTQHTRIGFRAKYVKKAVQEILNKTIDLDSLHLSEQPGVLLQTLHGVGPKVADCVALFALGHDHVIPFDVWMKRVFTQIYQQPENAKYKDLQNFAYNYFGPYAGWAHQFLFMYSRQHGLEKLKE